jgi:hypothetical protein
MQGMVEKRTGKRKNKATEPKPDPHKGLAIGFRADGQDLVDALDGWAEATSRSRNNAMNVLLMEALKAHGFWPPKRE